MAERLHLTKHHGLRNDFLVALEADNPGLVLTSELAVRLCDRTAGIGADGLIGTSAPSGEFADQAECEMVLFNADGSRAEISGNGIRCLGQALLRNAGRREGSVSIVAGGGVRHLTATATELAEVDQLSVAMARVLPGPPLSPEAQAFPAVRSGTGDVGNPHLVLQVLSLDGIDPAVMGRDLERGFPGGINVHFMVVDGPDRIRLSHWERGAGVTQACGSGATVAASLAVQWGVVTSPVAVVMPGGEATVVCGEEPVLIGPAVLIARSEVGCD